MRKSRRPPKASYAALALLAGCGDILNNQAIHAHVDDLVANHPAEAVPADRFALDAGLLVPGYGTYELDQRVFGSTRPSGIVFDWILGGLVPAAMLGASFVVDDARTRRDLRWGAAGLYAATRIGVYVIGNLHISEYDDYLERKQGTARVIGAQWTW